jgi:PAS domain S-box-containing protein
MNIGDEVLQTLMDAIPAPIFYKDSELIYRGCNAAFLDFIGLPREKILGQSVYGVSPRHLAEVFHKADAELLRRGGIQIYEADVKYADGSLHKVEFRKSVFKDSITGAPGGMIGVMLDVTELRSTEAELLQARDRAEAAHRSKSLFLANVSHELRTPLNAILGFSQIIGDELLGPVGNKRYVGYAGDIVRSGHFLLGLIDNILDLSRIDAKQSDLDVARINLAELVEQCIADVEIGVGAGTNISLTSTLTTDLPNIATDGARLRQVLLNLITNAVKYGRPTGSVTISAEHAREAVILKVTDDGIGIGADAMDTVFEPFQRADAKPERDSTGFGLGLPIARAIMEQLGGGLDLESKIGVGTTATLTLPLEPNGNLNRA